MQGNAAVAVCPDGNAEPPAGSIKLVNGVLRGMRRRGLPANVDPDDLRQEGLIAVWRSGKRGPPRLLAKIARDAMRDHLRRRARDVRGEMALVVDDHGEFIPPRARRDPFLAASVDDLAARHSEWERGRGGIPGMSEYYVFTRGRDENSGYMDGCILWWREAGKGYTCDLNDAGVFTDDDRARGYPSPRSCAYVPKEIVDARARSPRLAWWTSGADSILTATGGA